MLLFLIPQNSVVSAVLLRVILRAVIGTSEAAIFLILSGFVANNRLSLILVFFLNNADRISFEKESRLVAIRFTMVTFCTK